MITHRKGIIFLLALLSQLSLYGNQLFSYNFAKNETILGFFEKHNIPQDVYYDLSDADKEVVTDIIQGAQAFILRDDDNRTKQVLVQINDLMQLHIYKGEDRDTFESGIIPIAYLSENRVLYTDVEHSVYQSIVNKIQSLTISPKSFDPLFFNTINFRKEIQKGDRMVIFYEEKLRFGKQLILPRIKFAMIETKKIPRYIAYYNDRYYDEQANLLEKFYIHPPVKGKVTSPFSYKRFHPVLKRYRAHHGIDYRARKGTRIKAVAPGKVIYKGWRGGYGKTVILEHINGYTSLYAHMEKFSPLIRKINLSNGGLSWGILVQQVYRRGIISIWDFIKTINRLIPKTLFLKNSLP